MNLAYDLIKKSNEITMTITVEKNKLNIRDFICYMQYEFFVSFFVSILSDIFHEKYKTFIFPKFRNASLLDNFELQFLFSDNVSDPFMPFELAVFEKQKYVQVVRSKNAYFFIPNKKNNIQEFTQMLSNENRLFLQKLFKSAFERIYLLLFHNQKLNLNLVIKNNFFMLMLMES